MFITIFLSFILIALVCNYYVPFGKKTRLLNLIPGPPGYPIIGNMLDGLGTREEQMKNLCNLLDQYYPICKFFSFVFIRHPDDLEIILNNKKHIEKSFIYDIGKPWLGTGLGTSKAAKWYSRRKLLTPAFHFNILQQFIDILIKESENMTNSLKNTEGIVVNDLISFISEHTLNAIIETALGTSLQDLEFQQQYRKAVEHITEIFIYRLFRPWLYIDWIYSLTPTGRKQKKVLKVLHGFTERIIAERKLYHERTNGRYLKDFGNDTSAERDDVETIKTRRKRLAMLDLLIAASRDGLMTDLDIREEVDTFVFGAHDTTAKAMCFALMLLAEHKDIQDRVRDEINTAMRGNDQKKFTKELLQQLPYLERCIKEALRLYPSAPFSSRVTGEDVKLQSYLVPAGTVIFTYVYGIHNDPNFWPNPEMFDPDRFLPENIQNRHSYLYLPFSAGPRNCIGQRFAMLEMKAMVASLIHNFYLEPIDYLKDVKLQADITLCPTQPLRIKFVPV